MHRINSPVECEIPNFEESQPLLDALDGISYLVGPDHRIKAIGRQNWDLFAKEGGGTSIGSHHVIGKNLFSMIVGERVQTVYRRFLDDLFAGKRQTAIFRYRCDAPTIRREMRMAMTPYRIGGRICGVLFHSLTLALFDRPALDLFGQRDSIALAGESGKKAVVTVCSFCADVTTEAPKEDEERRWITAETYYQEGGESDVLVSHGTCESCFAAFERSMSSDAA